jgi:N-acetylmuramoyl-L-alanine amidase
MQDPQTLLLEVDQLAEVCDAGTKVVVIGAANDILLFRELMRRGVSEYLVAPLQPLQLISAIGGLFADPAQPFVGRTIAFVGARGGTGASSVAHNTAFAMSERIGANTVIVDYDLPFGTAGLDFNQDPLSGVADALSQPDRLDPVLLDRMMVRCTDKLSLFAAPATLDVDWDISPEAFEEVTTQIRSTAPFVVLDLPHLWSGWMRRTLIAADEVVIVATPDLASLRNAKNMIDLIRQGRPNDAPPRLVLDVREVDWTGIAEVPRASVRVTGLRAGVFRPGWSRLVMEMNGPFLVDQAEMRTEAGSVRLALRLEPASPADFAARAARPEPEEWTAPKASDQPAPERRGDGPVVVVLDPGHGGIDPGAERAGLSEADLMLTFARELKETLLRSGGFTVVLTRNEDVFVPLETRISIARAAGATAFLSLHADALAEGEAVGATIYTLAAEASDAAAATLAERHDRDDLLSGVDLTGQDDLVAEVLMDMARTETLPRTRSLAETLRAAIDAEGLKMHRIPLQQAGFSVLKSPEVPSVLIELGFMSSPRDLDRLRDSAWRARMAQAIAAGLQSWSVADAARQQLRRK